MKKQSHQSLSETGFSELRICVFVGGMVLKPALLAMAKKSSQAIQEFNEIAHKLRHKRIFSPKEFSPLTLN